MNELKQFTVVQQLQLIHDDIEQSPQIESIERMLEDEQQQQ
jgi:hypothetical protein